MIPQSTFVIGGCRSGKSRHALELAAHIAGSGKYFVATCVPRDAEMHQRVDAHRKERGADWKTLEAPLEVAKMINTYAAEADVMLIDCLTLWVSNLLMENEDPALIQQRGRELAEAVRISACPVILVSNEVGLGIVPENRLARLFRDAAGAVNQTIAAACEQVWMTVAGIPVRIK